MDRPRLSRRAARTLALIAGLAIVPSTSAQVRPSLAPGVRPAGEDISVANTSSLATDVVYQIITDRFFDGDPSNNPGGALHDPSGTNLRRYHGGDWQGIIQRIQDKYLTQMGVTAIWISPPVENIDTLLPDFGGSASYHGYWARDFVRPNPYFGSDADFERLVQVAHRHGIKVVIDFAPNHSNPATASPSYGENGALYEGGAWLGRLGDDPSGFFHPYGDTSFSSYEDGVYRNLLGLADFNHASVKMDAMLQRWVRRWVDTGIDGIRIDAVKHTSSGWLETFADGILEHRPVFLFGEWFLSPGEVDPVSHDFANETGISLLDFRFAHAARAALRDGTTDMNGFEGMLSATASDYDEVIDQVTFIDNHDVDRFHFTGADPRRLELALVLLLTSRGVPVVYYGTEQYLTGNGDPGNRCSMPGFDRTTTAYRAIERLAPLRKSNRALAYGDTQERWVNADVLVFEREFAGEVVLVAVNRSSASSYSLSGVFTSLPPGTYQDELGGLLSGSSLSVGGGGVVSPFSLGPGEAAVWQHSGSTASPTIGNVGPTVATVGRTLTIDGAGFGPQPGWVLCDGQPVTPSAWSATQVQFQLPSLAAGLVDVRVETSAGLQSPPYPGIEVRTARQVPVRFIVDNAQTVFGENVYLVGNVSELGGWSPGESLGPMFNQVVYQYPTWYIDVSAPAGAQLEFKFVKINGGQVVWEGGSNHTYTVPAEGTGEVRVGWQR